MKQWFWQHPWQVPQQRIPLLCIEHLGVQLVGQSDACDALPTCLGPLQPSICPSCPTETCQSLSGPFLRGTGVLALGLAVSAMPPCMAALGVLAACAAAGAAASCSALPSFASCAWPSPACSLAAATAAWKAVTTSESC